MKDFTLPEQVYLDLISFLESEEDNIKESVDGYGILKSVFNYFITNNQLSEQKN